MHNGKLFKTIRRITSLLVFCIIVTSISIISYILIKNQYDNVTNSDRNILFSIQKQIDNSFNFSFKLAEKNIISPETISYIKDDTNSSYNLLQLSKKVENDNLLVQPFGCIWGLFKEDGKHYITTQGALNFQQMQKYGYLSADLIKEIPQYDKSIVSGYISAKPFIQNPERYIGFISKHLLPETNNKPVYTFVILDMSYITSSLQGYNPEYFSIYFDDSLLFGHQNHNLSDQNLSHSGVLGGLSFAYSTQDHHLFYGIIISFFALLLLSFFGLKVVSFISMLIYRPIQNIIDRLSYDIDEENIEESELVIQHIELIEKYNENLNRRIYAFEENAKSEIVRNILFYGKKFQGTIPQEIIKLLNNACLSVLEFTLYVFHDITEIAKKMEQLHPNGVVIIVSNDRIALIEPYTNLEQNTDAMMKLALFMEKNMNICTTVAISNQDIQSASDLNTAYLQALELLKNKYLYSNSIIITPNTITQKSESYYYPLDTERNIIESVLIGNYEIARQEIKSLLNINLLQEENVYINLTEFKFAVTGTFKRIITALNKTEQKIFGPDTVIYLEFGMCKTPKALYDKILEFFETVILYTEQTSATNNKLLGHKLMEYIQSHYQSADLSLSTLAEHFNLTINHVSRTFKQYTGVNFKDYLTSYRVEKACEILTQQPNIKIITLAEMVGYDNSARFIRNFKKLKNVSPGQYSKIK